MWLPVLWGSRRMRADAAEAAGSAVQEYRDTRATLRAADGAALAVRTVCPAGGDRTCAVLYYVHGLGEHCGARYDEMFAALADAGVRVHAMDMRGHGQTAAANRGRRVRVRADILGHVGDSVDTMHRDMDALLGLDRGPDAEGLPRVLMGHSMGGLLALSYAVRGAETAEWSASDSSDSLSTRGSVGRRGVYVPRYADGLAGVVASAPALALTRDVSHATRALCGVLGRVAPRMTVDCGFDVGRASRDAERMEMLRADPLRHGRVSVATAVALYSRARELMARAERNAGSADACVRVPAPRAALHVAHGDDDAVTSADASRAFVAHAPWAGPREICVYPAMRHSLHQDVGREAVIREYVRFVTRLTAEE